MKTFIEEMGGIGTKKSELDIERNKDGQIWGGGGGGVSIRERERERE